LGVKVSGDPAKENPAAEMRIAIASKTAGKPNG
jgi:hypothetical protein